MFYTSLFCIFCQATLPCHVLCSLLPPLPHSAGPHLPHLPLSPFWTASFGLPKAIPSLLLLRPMRPLPLPALLPRHPPACAGLQPIFGFLIWQCLQKFSQKCQNIWILWINNHRAPVETVAQSVCRFVRLLPSLIFLQGCILFYCDTLKHSTPKYLFYIMQ